MCDLPDSASLPRSKPEQVPEGGLVGRARGLILKAALVDTPYLHCKGYLLGGAHVASGLGEGDRA